MKSAPSLAIEAEGRRVVAGLVSLLAAMAVAALFLAELGLSIRLLLLAAIALMLGASLRALWRQPRRLWVASDGTASTEPGAPPRRLAARRYGPLLVLSLTGPSGVTRLVLLRRLLGGELERQIVARAGAP